MDKGFEAIDKALSVKTEIANSTKPKRKEAQDDPTKDYEYSRTQFYNLIEKGQEAVDGILDVAGDSQHPRAYEVAGQLIKHIADTTDKLVDLQKKVKELDEDNPKTPNSVTNNALFVGSTSELSKMLKKGFLNNKDTKSD